MIRSILSRMKSVVKNEISGRKNRQIHYISDMGNWSFKWDANYITKGMSRRLGCPVPINTPPWNLRHQILIFGNRYAWFAGPKDRLHHSNKVVVTWFHGDPDDQNPRMIDLFNQLPSVFNRVDQVVVTNSISADVLVDHGVPREKLVNIPLGVDLSLFMQPGEEERQQIRQSMGIPYDTFCIGSFQKDGEGWEEGLTPKKVKGPDVFLKTMALLKKDHDNLMVILTGPARGYVKKGLDELGIPYRHRYFDNYPDIIPFYQALDLYYIASRAEGGPKALLEGWACGVPLISTRVGMPADFIRSGENGLLVDVEDAGTAAKHISRLIRNPDELAAIRAKGLETVQQFDWQNVADSYLEMVKRL
jgi:glycosyltransferase involved in cell wall biosynthesis